MTPDQQRSPGVQATAPDDPAEVAKAPQGLSGDFRRAVFKAAACLLGYPDDAFWQLLPAVVAYFRDLQDMQPAAALVTAAAAMGEWPRLALAALYVATFDFGEPTALYLTAHELGDSRRRGSALLALRSMLRAAGFEPTDTELPDYLPLLFEFLASAPEDCETSELERRLAVVCLQIHSKLADGHPYRGVFTALLGILPNEERTSPQPPFPLREEADTGELPYPLRYD
jgi:nitrate reductase delta subunit